MKHPLYSLLCKNFKWEARRVSAVGRVEEVIQMVLLVKFTTSKWCCNYARTGQKVFEWFIEQMGAILSINNKLVSSYPLMSSSQNGY